MSISVDKIRELLAKKGISTIARYTESNGDTGTEFLNNYSTKEIKGISKSNRLKYDFIGWKKFDKNCIQLSFKEKTSRKSLKDITPTIIKEIEAKLRS